MKTQVSSFRISLFPKILSFVSFGNLWCNSCVQFGDNLVFYFSNISWLQLQQETKWVNINFERRNLTSARKSHSVSNDLYVQLCTYLTDVPFLKQKT